MKVAFAVWVVYTFLFGTPKGLNISAIVGVCYQAPAKDLMARDFLTSNSIAVVLHLFFAVKPPPSIHLSAKQTHCRY